MRIISGSHKGRRLHPPAGLPVRPTTDQAKESLFNILWNRFEFDDLKVLDLFSGTGSIAFEFASRGCAEITAIDMNQRCTDFIKKMALELNFKQLYAVRSDVFSFLSHTNRKWDIIFVDPPYDLGKIETLPGLILPDHLENGGWLIIEHSKHTDFSGNPYFMELRNYGKVHFSFFVNSSPENSAGT
jgi:16S rRNA (guanine966-N2)-methyltransferase